MVYKDSLVLCIFLTLSRAEDLTFPPGFKFGAASAAYQVEEAWNVTDKTESIWDRFVHTKPDRIIDHSTGDVACDSYRLYKVDVLVAVRLGLHFYRFSISWPRLLPTGYPNVISQDGFQYYDNLINELLKYNIEPVVTLYHWDLPQTLQDLGGWTNPLITEWFADYARAVFRMFADRVKTWITINEPVTQCNVAYITGIKAPGLVDPYIAPYLCNKNMLVAHAKAWRIYDEEFRKDFHGKVSLSNYMLWSEGATTKDSQLAELANQYTNGMYLHAFFSKKGGWPLEVERIIAKNSRRQGYPESRLPEFTREEKMLVRGAFDFFGLNYYTSRLVRKSTPEELSGKTAGRIPEIGVTLLKRPEWPQDPTFDQLASYPEGLRNILKWIKKNYGDMDIFITENGFSSVNEDNKIKYLKKHMKQVLLAIKEDGINVTAYTVWTLMDNFEWEKGYTAKFGLYRIDFNDKNRKRFPQNSALFYNEVIKRKSL